MPKIDAPIGAMDSGVGGLTVVRNLRRLLPCEDVLFFGDSANCPYGNRSEDEIFALAMQMIRGFERAGVKCVVIACNTISAIIDRLTAETELRLFSIVDSAAKYVTGLGLHHCGLVATESVVNGGVYARKLRALDPEFKLTAQGSRTLAEMIDRGTTQGEELETQIRLAVDEIFRRGEREKLILGCTHYPIVRESFENCCPGTELIDPSRAQAEEVAAWLGEMSLLRAGHEGALSILTTGDAELFERVCRQLGIAGGVAAEYVEKF